MSYILDALNKSENERRAGVLPGLAPGASFVVAPRKATRRGGAAFLLGAGMLVTGLALGNWRPWQQLAVVPPVELAAASPSLGEVPGQASPGPADKPAPKPVAQLKPQPTVPALGKPKMAAKAPLPTPGQLQPAAVAGDAPTPPLKATAVAPPAAGRVVAYRELPSRVKGRLPKITFGGFAGVDEAEVRIAFINDRLVKEGEEVSPGVKLEKVGNDGVVLGYQGHHFRP